MERISLRVLYLGLGVVDIVDGQEQLVIMLVRSPTIFCAAIS